MGEREALTAAYMAACKDRSADWNEIGYWYFRQAWEAAVKHEREACAKECDDFGASYDNEWNRKLGVANDLKDACDECALAIRSRSSEG